MTWIQIWQLHFAHNVVVSNICRRDPMLKKTKMTNEKIIMQKSNAQGIGYTNPEKLSKQI